MMVTIVGPAFIPPAQYSGLWNVVAAAIVIGAILLIVAIVRSTRARRSDATDIDWIPVVDRDATRERYLGLIDDAEADHRAGRMRARQLHQRMSFLVREFVFEIDGVNAPTMTLSDLRATRHHPLGDTVSQLYPGEFAPIDRGSPGESAELARRLVRSWS